MKRWGLKGRGAETLGERRAQGGALLFQVRPEVLLEEDQTGRKGLCGGLGGNEKRAVGLNAQTASGLSPHLEEARSAVSKDEAEAGMREMSEKSQQMGGEVYLDADKIKESNKAL